MKIFMVTTTDLSDFKMYRALWFGLVVYLVTGGRTNLDIFI